MRLGEALRNLNSDIERLVDRERPALDLRLERFAFVAGHGDEELPLGGLVDFMDSADVRVIEGRGGPGFLDKTLLGFAFSRELGGRNLSATVRPSFVSSAR